jgi:putative transposase
MKVFRTCQVLMGSRRGYRRLEATEETASIVDFLQVLNYDSIVKLTVQVQLRPTPDQRRALLATMNLANAACDWISSRAWNAKVFAQFSLHKVVYYPARAQFPGLSSQMIVRCEAKVADAYKLDRDRQRFFRPLGAIAYDQRVLSWKGDTASIWTVDGRQTIPFVCGPRQHALLRYDRGETDLVHRDGRFYLLVSVDVPDVEEKSVTEFIGVDLGISHLATDSDGTHYDNPGIEAVRVRRAEHRRRLGRAKGARRRSGRRTRSINRAIRRHRGRESRYRSDVNHCIARKIVATAQGTGRGIAVENLNGIRERTSNRLRRGQRSKHSSWAFFQLRQFVAYKAALASVCVVAVDPRNTSRTCNACGHCDKANRRSQSVFKCRACGHEAQADHNAARNIARKAAVNRPKESESLAAPVA